MSLINKLKILKLPKSVYWAIAGCLICTIYLVLTQFKDTELKPPREPASKPYQKAISGVGIIESKDKNIEIAPFYGGIVEKVYVKEGDKVNNGSILYQLNTDTLKAQLHSHESSSKAAATYLAKLKASPRPEDIPSIEASLKGKEAKYQDLLQYVDRLQKVSDPRSISQNDLASKRYELASAKAEMEQTKAELSKLKAGSWKYDIRQAQYDYEATINRVKEIRTSISQAFIKSPIDALVLQVNVKEGEYISPSSSPASVIIGKSDQLQVRVDIDEINASRVRTNMPALAFVKGHSYLKFPLRFVRIEPYMVPKTSLTGNSGERTDTRVLQIIYEFSPPDFPVYVGQQVEVYLNEEISKNP